MSHKQFILNYLRKNVTAFGQCRQPARNHLGKFLYSKSPQETLVYSKCESSIFTNGFIRICCLYLQKNKDKSSRLFRNDRIDRTTLCWNPEVCTLQTYRPGSLTYNSRWFLFWRYPSKYDVRIRLARILCWSTGHGWLSGP